MTLPRKEFTVNYYMQQKRFWLCILLLGMGFQVFADNNTDFKKCLEGNISKCSSLDLEDSNAKQAYEFGCAKSDAYSCTRMGQYFENKVYDKSSAISFYKKGCELNDKYGCEFVFDADAEYKKSYLNKVLLEAEKNTSTYYEFRISLDKIANNNELIQVEDTKRIIIQSYLEANVFKKNIITTPNGSEFSSIVFLENPPGDEGDSLPESIHFESTKGAASSMIVTDSRFCKSKEKRDTCDNFIRVMESTEYSQKFEVFRSRLESSGASNTFISYVETKIYPGAEKVRAFIATESQDAEAGDVYLFIYAKAGNNLIEIREPLKNLKPYFKHGKDVKIYDSKTKAH